ncbi:MAG TPA: GNAT family N-acetyltransferase, partial [Lachnospiraceae bacterium]|nr:GNAT family N-acetyltransferase [Lachnospiraceae bacterium]
KSFNELAEVTFGLDFENWYKNGYWTDRYVPYSIITGNKVVSNVSVNKMEFAVNGENKKYMQLGTVMTDEKYRNQGLIKRIMQEIEKDFQDSVDGFYLFANDRVLDFYPRFGYRKGIEYQYSKVLRSHLHRQAKQISMNHKEDWLILEKAIELSVSNSAFEMRNNKELIMFYVTQFMQENVYYIEEEGAYVIAEINGNELFLHNIFAEKEVNMETIIDAFGDGLDQVVFGFTPLTSQGYQVKRLCEKDTTLFLKGRDFDLFEQKRGMFPSLSHA